MATTYRMVEVQPLGGQQVPQLHYQTLNQHYYFSDLDLVIVLEHPSSFGWRIGPPNCLSRLRYLR